MILRESVSVVYAGLNERLIDCLQKKKNAVISSKKKRYTFHYLYPDHYWHCKCTPFKCLQESIQLPPFTFRCSHKNVWVCLQITGSWQSLNFEGPRYEGQLLLKNNVCGSHSHYSALAVVQALILVFAVVCSDSGWPPDGKNAASLWNCQSQKGKKKKQPGIGSDKLERKVNQEAGLQCYRERRS